MKKIACSLSAIVALIASSLYAQEVGGPSSGGGGGGGGGSSSFASATYTTANPYWFAPVAGTLPAVQSATITNQIPAGSSGAISAFVVNVGTAPSGSNTLVFTWYDNGVAQAVTCTVTSSSTVGGQPGCPATGLTFNFSTSDLLVIKMAATGGSTTTTVSMSWGTGQIGPQGPAGPAPSGTGAVVVNSGAASAVTVSGDGALNTITGALSVTKTAGVPFAPSATTDTTNAANISSGILSPSVGGTGVNNGAFTISLAGNITFSGSFNPTFVIPSTGSWTFPAPGNLVNTSVTALSSLATVGTISAGTWQGTVIAPAYGGNGVANTATHTLGTSNQNWATLGTGIVKNTTTTGAISNAVAADVYGLWSGTCNSSSVLYGDGACRTAGAGSGTLTNFTAGSASPFFTTSVANPTTTPALTFGISNAAQNSILAGPATGGAGAPTYQTIPTFNASNLTNIPLNVTANGSSGPATYTQGTNTLNIPQYTGGGSGNPFTVNHVYTYSGTILNVDFSTFTSATVTPNAGGVNPTLTFTAPTSSLSIPLKINLCNFASGTPAIWTVPSNTVGIGLPVVAGECVLTLMTYNSTTTNFEGTGSTDTPSRINFSAERAVTGPVPAGGTAYPQSSSHNFHFLNSSAVDFGMVKSGQDVNVDAGTVGSYNGGTAFGTAASKNTGTSGATVPILNVANTWGATQIFSHVTLEGVTTTGAQGNGPKVQFAAGSATTGDCVKYDANGNTIDAGAPCGSGSGGGAGASQLIIPYSAPIVPLSVSVTSPVTVANTGSATSIVGKTYLGSATLPAGYYIGKSYRMALSGLYSTTSLPTLTVIVSIGGVTIATITPTILTSASNDGWEFTYTFTVASMTSVNGSGCFRNVGTSGAIIGGCAGATTSGLNFATSQLVDVTVTWGTPSASNTLTAYTGQITPI